MCVLVAFSALACPGLCWACSGWCWSLLVSAALGWLVVVLGWRDAVGVRRVYREGHWGRGMLHGGAEWGVRRRVGAVGFGLGFRYGRESVCVRAECAGEWSCITAEVVACAEEEEGEV